MPEMIDLERLDIDVALLYAITDWIDRVLSRADGVDKELRACSKRLSDLLSVHIYKVPSYELRYILPAMAVYAENHEKMDDEVGRLYTTIARALSA